MLAYTNKARESHIKEITKIIDILGSNPNSELNYTEYRETVQYLSMLRDMYKKEMEGKTIKS